MQMVKNPAQFEVIVTNNMFGDIVTDLGAQLQGGLGMAASGNLHPGRTSMFEPVHGSAPKYAGKNVANPVGAILSAALMLEYGGLTTEARAIEAAVKESVVTRHGTAEIGGTSARVRPGTTLRGVFAGRLRSKTDSRNRPGIQARSPAVHHAIGNRRSRGPSQAGRSTTEQIATEI